MYQPKKEKAPKWGLELKDQHAYQTDTSAAGTKRDSGTISHSVIVSGWICVSRD